MITTSISTVRGGSLTTVGFLPLANSGKSTGPSSDPATISIFGNAIPAATASSSASVNSTGSGRLSLFVISGIEVSLTLGEAILLGQPAFRVRFHAKQGNTPNRQ